MKVAYSPYTLKAKRGALYDREGALLRMVFQDESVGYADCHPWTVRGDLPLQEQLAHLAKKQLTPLTRQSLYFAEIDAIARCSGRSLWEGVQIPPSHFLVTSILQCPFSEMERLWEEGITLLKIKMSGTFREELKHLSALLADYPFKVRLDFNASLSLQAFTHLLDQLKHFFPKIDFIEDPLPFHPEQWSQIQRDYPVQLACDVDGARAIGDKSAAAVVVVKPAVERIDPFFTCTQQIVITSYMDHPLGQVAAAYVAATFPKPVSSCGLLTHLIYQTNSFSAELSQAGPHLIAPSGLGFGFDKQLQKSHWTAL